MRILLTGCLLLLSAAAHTASREPTISPILAEQLRQIVENASRDADAALARLKKLAQQRRRPNDLMFIMRERAALLIQEDQLDVAREELRETLAGQPPEYAPVLRYQLGQLYLMEDQAELAIEQLSAWAAYAENPGPARLFMLGYAYVRLERFEEAAEVLERVIAGDLQIRPPWVEILAYTYARLGRSEEAVELLHGLIEAEPALARWWRQLAAVYLLMEDLPNGATGLAVAKEIEGMTLTDARRLARLLTYLGMPIDGAWILTAALGADDAPATFEDRMLLAETWILAREFESAVAALTDAASVATDGEPSLVMGQLYLQREQYEPARNALREARDAYGEDAPSRLHYLLAVAEINLGALDEAEAAIVAFEADPDMARRASPLRDYIRVKRLQ